MMILIIALSILAMALVLLHISRKVQGIQGEEQKECPKPPTPCPTPNPPTPKPNPGPLPPCPDCPSCDPDAPCDFSEGFQGGCRKCRVVLDTSVSGTKPYMTNEDKYGDYEQDHIDRSVWMDNSKDGFADSSTQDFVFNSEGGRQATKDAINASRQRYPFDWAQLPTDSSVYQQNQALFNKESKNAAPYKDETFIDINGDKLLPPGTYMDPESRTLQMYKPSETSGYLKTEPSDVKKWLTKMYKTKGVIPEIVEKDNNVYEIVGVQEINPKIVYEDEVPQTQMSVQSNTVDSRVDPDSMIVVPTVASDFAQGLDPFSTVTSKTSMGRNNYDQWSPDLQTMFGPNMQWQQYG